MKFYVLLSFLIGVALLLAGFFMLCYTAIIYTTQETLTYAVPSGNPSYAVQPAHDPFSSVLGLFAVVAGAMVVYASFRKVKEAGWTFDTTELFSHPQPGQPIHGKAGGKPLH